MITTIIIILVISIVECLSQKTVPVEQLTPTDHHGHLRLRAVVVLHGLTLTLPLRRRGGRRSIAVHEREGVIQRRRARHLVDVSSA